MSLLEVLEFDVTAKFILGLGSLGAVESLPCIPITAGISGLLPAVVPVPEIGLR